METISLAPYVIKIKYKHDSQYFNFDDVSGEDFLKLVSLHATSLKGNLFKANDALKSLGISEYDCDPTTRVIKGTFQYGHFGKKANIVNIDDNEINFEKEKEQAVVQPFYFLIEIPKERNEGIIIFQRLGLSGVKTIFHQSINQYVNEYFGVDKTNDYTVQIIPLTPKNLLEKYLQENRILKIRYIKYGLQKDIANTYPHEDHEEGKVCSEYVLSTSKKRDMPNKILEKTKQGFKAFFLDNAPLSNIVAIENFEVDAVKVEFQIGKSTRTINLSNTEKFKYHEDITDTVEVDNTTGHPKFGSINLLASNLLSDLKQEIWGKKT